MDAPFVDYTPETGFLRAEELIAACKATRSVSLDLGNLSLERIPESLGDCVWLEVLNLGDYFLWDEEKNEWERGQGGRSRENKNLITDLSLLTRLEGLQILGLQGTLVSDVGPLSGLVALTDLNLWDTQVSDVGPLTGLVALTELDLSSTQVSDVGPLAGLIALINLDLGSNQVSDVGPIAGLVALTKLDLWRTEVSDVGPLSGLAALTELQLSETQVSDVGPLAGLVALTNLDLWNTQVSDISPLAGLAALTELQLSETQVSDVGPLAGLVALTNLDLWSTQVSDVGPLVGLVALTELDLGFTQVSDVGPLVGLVALTKLNLSRTQVSDVGPLSGLVALTNLNLWSTQVSDVGPLSGLVALTKLNLSGTEVLDVGPLSGLVALTELDLSGTQVSDIGPLAGLSSLKSLNLTGIATLPLPPELLFDPKTAYKNILAWEADIKRGRHPNALFKLIVCGNGTVGKTKIAKRIETEKYLEDGESTHGVKIYLTEEQPFAPGHPPVRLSIWDFAGQEIYYQLHRLFFRQRAVYLVVFDRTTMEERFQPDPITGRPDENRPLEYWLNDIRASAKDAPIILVQNKLDEEGEVSLENRLPEAFQQLPLVRISAKTGLRFNELLVDIHQAIAALPRVGMELPESWWRVREEIMRKQQDEDDDTQLLSKEAFVALAQEHHLCENSEEALLAYLDGSGVVLYDKDLFPESVVIDQQWALDAIYTVLDRVTEEKSLSSQQKLVGQFQLACGRDNGRFLPHELPFDGYTEREQSLFLKIMQRAGICFQTNAKSAKGEDYYIMFQYLRPEASPLVWDLWAVRSRDGVVAQRFVFPHQLHKGVFRELVRQVLPKTELKNLWQRGLLVRWKGAVALVRVSYRDRESYLEISGTGSSHEVRHLQAAFHNVVYAQLKESAAWEHRVSNDGDTWFTPPKLKDAGEMEAKFALSVTGQKVANWRELNWWLQLDREANFDSLPEEQHEESVVEPESAMTPAGKLFQLKQRFSEATDLLVVAKQLQPLLPEGLQDNLILIRRDVVDFQKAELIGNVSRTEMWSRQNGLGKRLLDLINLALGSVG